MTSLTIVFFLKFRFWGGDESEVSERERFARLQIQLGKARNRVRNRARAQSVLHLHKTLSDYLLINSRQDIESSGKS